MLPVQVVAILAKLDYMYLLQVIYFVVAPT